MLSVWSNALAAADSQQVTLRGLLDFSTAIDCADYDLLRLLLRLEGNVGPTGTVLAWVRTQQIAYGGQLSTTEPVLFDVPQGSLLDSLLSIVYTSGLSRL